MRFNLVGLLEFLAKGLVFLITHDSNFLEISSLVTTTNSFWGSEIWSMALVDDAAVVCPFFGLKREKKRKKTQSFLFKLWKGIIKNLKFGICQSLWHLKHETMKAVGATVLAICVSGKLGINDLAILNEGFLNSWVIRACFLPYSCPDREQYPTFEKHIF